MRPRPLQDWIAAPQWRGAALGLRDLGSRGPAAALWVPGRVELFGKHTDYAGGASLATAIAHGLRVLVTAGDDDLWAWWSREAGNGGDLAEFDPRRPRVRHGDWRDYLSVTLDRLERDGGVRAGGVTVAMTSDLPAAAGLSSSSALVVAAFMVAMATAVDAAPGPWADSWRRRAAWLGAVESGRAWRRSRPGSDSAAPDSESASGGGVGTRGGCQDHAAILGAEPNHVLHLRFGTELEAEAVPVPGDWVLLVGVSGVVAHKAAGARDAFNALSRSSSELVELWSSVGRPSERRGPTALPSLGGILESGTGPPTMEKLLAALSEARRGALSARWRHFAAESGEIVPEAVGALRRGDSEELGRLARESQRLAEELLGNQVAETSSLARLAGEAGAFAASAFGAGFGGAVWALADRREAKAVLERWRETYLSAWPQHRSRARFFETDLAAGARWVEEEFMDTGTREEEA